VLTDNINLMAMNLMNQVRSIAEVTKAVAGGDLTSSVEVDLRGEILELKETVVGMTESFSAFADEATRVAGEVGRKIGRAGEGDELWWDAEGFDRQRQRFCSPSYCSVLPSGSDVLVLVDLASPEDCCRYRTHFPPLPLSS